MSDRKTEPGRPVTVTKEADDTATQATTLDPLATPLPRSHVSRGPSHFRHGALKGSRQL